MWKTWAQSLDGEGSLEGGHGNPLQYSYLETPHGQRSLAGYSAWGHTESDMTEQLSSTLFLYGSLTVFYFNYL